MTSVAARIVELIHAERMAVGTHLPAQLLADRLNLSRSPVNDALALLFEKGVLAREKNRGYFIAQIVTPSAVDMGLSEEDVVTATYFKIAEDRLSGQLPDAFSDVLIKNRYHLTVAQRNAVLGRMVNEGWVHKKPGYGWMFSPMLTTPDSLMQSYRLRLALEPAALLEPNYRLDRQALERCREAEYHLLAGGIETDTPDQLHIRGVRFHETLVDASGNAFFIDTIQRVNRVRRLLSYRSMQDRSRYKQHCDQHLHILDLLEKERNDEAAAVMKEHLLSTLRNLGKLHAILDSPHSAD